MAFSLDFPHITLHVHKHDLIVKLFPDGDGILTLWSRSQKCEVQPNSQDSIQMGQQTLEVEGQEWAHAE